MNLTQFHRILTQMLLLPVLALAVVATILVWQVRSAERTVTAIQASDESIAAGIRAQKILVGEETGLRGFQITSEPAFLRPSIDSVQPFRQQLDLVRRNLRQQGQSTHQVDAIEAGEQTWRVSFAEPLIAMVTAGGDTRDLSQNLLGKKQMDDLRDRIGDLLEEESTLRAGGVAKWRTQVQRTIGALLLLVLAAGIIISVSTIRQLHRVSDAYQATLDNLRLHAQATFESEERLRTTLRSIGDGVIVCAPDGTVELLNTVAQELTGWSEQEAFSRPLEDVFHIVHETTRQVVETPVAKVKRLKGVVTLPGQTVIIRRDGSEISIDHSGAPIYDRTGTLSGIVMVFRDITPARHAQSVLLATEKLAVAGRLAATIAHEMHNPLDSVSNLLYLLREEKDPLVSEHYLDLAQQELARMGQVSRAMLGLYREAKTPVLINVKEMLESVFVLLDRSLQQGQISLETHLPDDLRIEGFPAELRQVFTNLIANAADASPPGGRIGILARRESGKTPGSGLVRNGVIVEVCDSGPGIDPHALEHIFEPFFTTKGELGTGLGLWFSRGIIDKHGGTIDIQSHTGLEKHGTTITVFMPLTGPANRQA